MLKLLSVLIAFLIWSYVKSDVDPLKERTFRDVEIRLENVQELQNSDFIVLPIGDQKLSVTVSGRLSNMQNVRKEGIIAKANLKDLGEGEHSLPISVNSVDSGISIDHFEPQTVSVVIDRKESQEMTTNIVLDGQLENSYVLGKVKDHEKVRVTGPKTMIDNITKLEAKVDINGLQRSTVMSIRVVPYNNANQIIESVTIEPSNIDVEIPIFKTETVPIKLNLQGTLPKDMQTSNFSIRPNSVTIRGNSAVIDRIHEITTKPISVQEVMNGNREIQLVLPEGVTLVDPDIKFYVDRIEPLSQ